MPIRVKIAGSDRISRKIFFDMRFQNIITNIMNYRGDVKKYLYTPPPALNDPTP
jgi:hypothetical protein